MNIIQQPVIFATTPDNTHIALGIFFVMVAIALFCLTLRVMRRPGGSSAPARYLHADYWITRARRRQRLIVQLTGRRGA
jgi:hypothetical protein